MDISNFCEYQVESLFDTIKDSLTDEEKLKIISEAGKIKFFPYENELSLNDIFTNPSDLFMAISEDTLDELPYADYVYMEDNILRGVSNIGIDDLLGDAVSADWKGFVANFLDTNEMEDMASYIDSLYQEFYSYLLDCWDTRLPENWTIQEILAPYNLNYKADIAKLNWEEVAENFCKTKGN